MTIKRAIDHFKWKLKNKWKPTETDVEAYNTLGDYIKHQEEQKEIDNENYYKLYIYLYNQFLVHYDCSISNKLIQVEINKILDKSTSTLLQELTDTANLNEASLQLWRLGVKSKHPLQRTEVEKEIINKNIENLDLGKWSFEKVNEEMMNTINPTLERTNK